VQSSLALFLAVFGALLLVAVLLDDFSANLQVPGILLVLLLGLLTDNNLEVTGGHGVTLLTLPQADQVTQVALGLVLFFGGLTTNWHELKAVLRPAIRLASLGALLTAVVIMAAVFGLESLPFTPLKPNMVTALFVGAMLCSTDATAVLAMLRPLTGRLPKKVLDLIECESAFNDPVAVLLAGLAMALATGSQGAQPSALVIDVVRQFLVGALLGVLGGGLAQQILSSRRSLTSPSMLAVVSLALLMLLMGGTMLLGGSALLAAYISGLVLANSGDCDRTVLEEAHAGFAKMAEMLMFLCLGLVVQLDQVLDLFVRTMMLFILMQLARWLVVHILLMGSAFRSSEKKFISLAGLRGAVPIALAIQAAASGVAWGKPMPALALGVVLWGLVLQGLTLVPAARRLGLASVD
jgi:NhaP-type Na+/H+ and K+/H+ antiporter